MKVGDRAQGRFSSQGSFDYPCYLDYYFLNPENIVKVKVQFLIGHAPKCLQKTLTGSLCQFPTLINNYHSLNAIP